MKRHNRRQGFALVLTLIIVVLTAVTVVAFLSTTLTERTTAVAYGRINKAGLFAEAGVDAAIARVVTEMTYRPYHAIGYRSVIQDSGQRLYLSSQDQGPPIPVRRLTTPHRILVKTSISSPGSVPDQGVSQVRQFRQA